MTIKIQTIDEQPLLIAAKGVVLGEGAASEPSPDESQTKLCRQWLARATPTHDSSLSSFWVKHVIENWAGTPISNGALIVAAHETGFPISRESDATHPNVNIGLTSSDVEEFDCGCGHP